MYNEAYLAHYGILGMKWGIRRYQNRDGTLTEAGKKRYAVNSDGSIRKLSSSERKEVAAAEKKKVEAQKQRAAALEKARRARAEKAEYEKMKADAIKSGDAKRIEKYFDDLKPEEVKEAMDRINAKQNFQKVLNSEAKLLDEGKTTTDRLMASVGKVTDYAETGIKAYNVIAKINNAFSDNFMPQIGTGKSRSEYEREQEEQRRKEAKAAQEERKAAREARQRKKVEKMINTADEYTLYKNRDKLSTKDWITIANRMNTEQTLFQNMANKKKGEINMRANEHRWLAEDYAKLAKEIPEAYAIRENARKKYFDTEVSLIDRKVKDHESQAQSYRDRAVNVWMTSGSEQAFDKIRDQFTWEEQGRIIKARGWDK